MKRKIPKILSVALALALVLSFSLVMAVPAAAAATLNVIPFTLEEEGDATANWTQEVAYNGNWSVKMDRGNSDYYAKVVVTSLSMPIDDLNSVSFMFNVKGSLSPWAERTTSGIPQTYDTPYAVLVLDDGSVLVHNNHRVLSNDDIWQTWPDAGDLEFNPATGEDWYPECNKWTLHGSSGDYEGKTKTLEGWKTVLDLGITELKIDFGGMPWEAASEATTGGAESVWAYVDDITINDVTYYGLIQDAIDSASSGDTIIVSDGIYTEDLKIENKTDITLRSENGRDVTTIQPVGAVKWGIVFLPGANDITIGGEAGHGFTIKSAPDETSGYFNIEVRNGNSGIEISHNTIDTTGQASRGISVGTGGATDLTVSYNKFIADADDGSFTNDVWIVDLAMTYNEFTGPATTTDWSYAIEVAGITVSSLTTSTVSNNDITGYNKGIIVTTGEESALDYDGGTSDLLISNNDITGCRRGISLQQRQTTNGDITTTHRSHRILS